MSKIDTKNLDKEVERKLTIILGKGSYKALLQLQNCIVRMYHFIKVAELLVGRNSDLISS